MKKIRFLILFICTAALLCACSLHPKEYQDWRSFSLDKGFGWYEITDATGAYKDLINNRIDSIMVRTDESVTFYDQNHYEESFIRLDADFEGKVVSATDGELCGVQLTDTSVKMRSDRDIEIPYSMWIEGTLTNAEGSITLQGFFSDADIVLGWNQIGEGDTGKLKIQSSQLFPENYALLKSFSNVDPYEYFYCLNGELPDDLFEVHMANAYPAEEQTKLIRLDKEEDFTQIVLTKDEAVKIYDITITALKDDGTEETVYSRDSIYLSELDGAVIQLTFGSGVPTYRLNYADYFGREYTYSFMQNADGSAYLQREN